MSLTFIRVNCEIEQSGHLGRNHSVIDYMHKLSMRGRKRVNRMMFFLLRLPGEGEFLTKMYVAYRGTHVTVSTLFLSTSRCVHSDPCPFSSFRPFSWPPQDVYIVRGLKFEHDTFCVTSQWLGIIVCKKSNKSHSWWFLLDFYLPVYNNTTPSIISKRWILFFYHVNNFYVVLLVIWHWISPFIVYDGFC